MMLLPGGRIKRFGLSIIVILLLTCIAVSIWYSEAITSITITLKTQATEPQDSTYLGLGKNNVLPDYKLLVRAHTTWYDLGVKHNTSAKEPIKFTIEKSIPWASVKALRLLESDRFSETQIEQVMIFDKTPASSQYRYQIETGFRFNAGLRWLFSTSIGKGLIIIVAVGSLVGFLGSIGKIYPE